MARTWTRFPAVGPRRLPCPAATSTMTSMADKSAATLATGHPALDEVSKSIIEQLQQDGRRSYASIGKAVGLSEAAVRQRVQRLTEAGVMQIVAVTDPLQLGFGRQAMVGIHVDGAIQPVADALSAMEEVIYVVMTAGTYDVLCEVVSTERRGAPRAGLGPHPRRARRTHHRDVHVPQAGQADLLVGCPLSAVPTARLPLALAVARDRRRRLRAAARAARPGVVRRGGRRAPG